MGSQSTDLSSLRRDCWGWLLPNPAARRVSYTDTRSIPFYLSPWIYRRAHRRAFTSNRRLNASSRFLNLSLRKRSAELTYRGRRNFWNTRLGKFRAISLEESSQTVIVADRFPMERRLSTGANGSVYFPSSAARNRAARRCNKG